MPNSACIESLYLELGLTPIRGIIKASHACVRVATCGQHYKKTTQNTTTISMRQCMCFIVIHAICVSRHVGSKRLARSRCSALVLVPSDHSFAPSVVAELAVLSAVYRSSEPSTRHT